MKLMLQEPNEEDINRDIEFMTAIISDVCAYAHQNNMLPDDTLKQLCENILELLEISTFNEMK